MTSKTSSGLTSSGLTSSGLTSSGLTSSGLTTSRLPRTSWVRRGYSVRQVHEAVAAIEAGLARDTPTVSARDVRRLGFSLRHHGYAVQAVDALMDDLEQRCTDAVLRTVPPWQLSDTTARDLGLLLQQHTGGAGQRFPRARRFRRGYDLTQVDALLARCAAALSDLQTGSWGGHAGDGLDADEVRSTVFRRRWHGYREEAVDRLFDEVVELLLRKAALARGGFAGGGR